MPAPTRLEPSSTDRALTWLLLVGGGALLGWGVFAMHGWLLDLEWFPWRGPVELVGRFADATGPWAPAVFVGAGIVLGAVLALLSVADEVRVTVADDAVTIVKGDSTRTHRAEDVREALLDAKHLVLVAENGTDLARVKVEVGGDALASAFTQHGYRWTDPTHPKPPTPTDG
ncbi:hypothetical protein Bcav_2691 [Beutenbergia cavernae DSM 12333]|uniref:YqeB PH domain-containing protein n=1 Tax=Beutenbergia cavernae (strain ATCC BAA-8 / DSM 12333 / CCUG 43141 / JCM 11478 / NBRC 16432 / NCIMB 13614 / HKI 0122) TaxID=471853 RepID=C5BXQ3_BEUC1|nr:hypothetical protein [Beutenbergia cavernae]ACQ80936.1 hypothetical protein Bcav_2691 [Beutenbergia cavernae DSM 12333]